jgi:hypothetical protein
MCLPLALPFMLLFSPHSAPCLCFLTSHPVPPAHWLLQSEHDVFYTFGYILAGIFVTGAFSMGLQGVAYGASYKCTSGDTTCLWVKEAASRFKLMLQLALGEGDIAKGVRGNFQVVVLIAILLVLIGQWRTNEQDKRRGSSERKVAP